MFHSHPSNFLKIRCWSVIQKECADKWPILGADGAGNTELVLVTSSGPRFWKDSLRGRLPWVAGAAAHPSIWNHRGFFSVVRPFLGTKWGHRGAPTWWPCWALCGPGVIHMQPGQPLPTDSFCSMCSHYPAVCCCNAPINFPFDILRAIYKSCRLSLVPSLMPGNKAAVASSSG